MKKTYLKHILLVLVIIGFALGASACGSKDDDDDPDQNDNEDIKGWDGESITYLPEDIALLGASIPQGYATINPEDEDTAIIKSLSPELDNYGGISTGVLTLDFNYAVIFQMDVVSVYSQYIVKLFVAGESEAFYVLSDEGDTGFVSINVVDSMLSDKYRERNTQPDPGYADGFIYDDQIKDCYFYIMPKGPDGELRTAEMVVKSITVSNYKSPSITSVSIEGPGIEDDRIAQLKGSSGVQLEATVNPDGVIDERVTWSSSDETIATVTQDGFVDFVGIGRTTIRATSVLDQSKSETVLIDVLSGFESPGQIRSELDKIDLSVGGNTSVDETNFKDLFKTTWGDRIGQDLDLAGDASDVTTLHAAIDRNEMLVENRFDHSIALHREEIERFAQGDDAFFEIELETDDPVGKTVYRNIDGMLTKVELGPSEDTLGIRFATKETGTWNRLPSYVEEGIVLYDDGRVTKYRLTIKNVSVIRDYDVDAFMDEGLWQDGDDFILAAGSVRRENDYVIIREENPTRYPYGGIVSEAFTVDPDRPIEVIIDVAGTNPSRVLWNIRIVYYVNDQMIGNPINLEASQKSGVHTISFDPAYDTFRIYLIANGSDIGVIAEGAEIYVRSLRLQYIDD